LEELPIAESLTFRRFRAGGSAFVELFPHGPAPKDIVEAAARAGYVAWAAFPIREDGQLTDYVLLYFDEPADWTSVDSRTLDAISSVVSIAVANQRLRRHSAVALEGQRRFVDHLAALQSLTGIGEAATGFQELAESMVALVVASLGAVGGCYGSITPDGRFAIRASANMAPEMTALAEGPFTVTNLSAARRLGAGEDPFIQSYADESSEALQQVAEAAGYTAFAVLPVRLDGRLEAVIVAYFNRPLGELALEQRMLDTVTRIAGISVANFRLREGLVVSEDRYRTLFEESPEAYLVLDEAGRIVAANAAASRLYRVSHGTLNGRDLGDFHEMSNGRQHGGPGADSATAGGEEIERLLAPGGRGTMRGAGLRADGSRFPDEVFLSRVVIGDDRRVLVRVHDLTEQERLQQELVQAQKMEAIGMLVSGVAHELNNPLAAIIGYSTLLRRDERLPDEMRHDAEMLLQEADRTRRIVQNLLDFARQRSPERHPTAVRVLVASTLQLQSYSIAAGQIDVRIDVPTTLPAVDIDRAQMQQVLLNLTQNAIQAIRETGQPGSIDVAAEAGSGRDGQPVVRLRITDSGPGVAPELRSQLFLPFFTTKAPGEGTGLGLSVSFGIVAAHGGRLWFEPGPNDRGASFVLELPVEGVPIATEPIVAAPIAVTPSLDVAGASPSITPAAAARTPSGAAAAARTSRSEAAHKGAPEVASAEDADGRLRVLVLDDEPSILAFLAKALAFAGYRAVIASSGAEAVAEIRRAPVAAVLCDHRMSGMSGTEAYEAVTAIRPELRRRFVFMSGDVLNPHLVDFAREHGIRLLPKPFDLDTVGRTLRDVLAEGGDPNQG
jgi:two-component system NtrC family sensor kinase